MPADMHKPSSSLEPSITQEVNGDYMDKSKVTASLGATARSGSWEHKENGDGSEDIKKQRERR